MTVIVNSGSTAVVVATLVLAATAVVAAVVAVVVTGLVAAVMVVVIREGAEDTRCMMDRMDDQQNARSTECAIDKC